MQRRFEHASRHLRTKYGTAIFNAVATIAVSLTVEACQPTIAREKQTALSRAHSVFSPFLRMPNQAELEAFAAARVSRAMRLAVIAAARAPLSFSAVANAPS